ncbi:MAG: GGDEF domain-containing protein [Rhodocyclaceae bacterium]|nr:GGDEF domain-containing protein [Rhodocyclaceae bacterium]
MKYVDSMEKSAEFLRQALPLMSRQAAALHPVSYAVWYEYVAGINPPLKASIDGRTKNGAVLDEQATLELFHKHIADIDEDVSRRVSEGFQKALADISRSASQAGDHASEYGRVLEKWSADLAHSTPGAGLGGAVDLLLRHTRNMQESTAALKANLDESRREIEQLRQEVRKARQDALADGLTGLMNRRGFDSVLAACVSACDAERAPSLLIADIDFFKRINDSYGHLFGDKVILGIAQILKDNVKGKDIAARYGGEEFVILLPETPLEGAQHLAEKIRSEVERCRIKRAHHNAAVGNITISVGVASYRNGESAHDFLGRADSALYLSKNQGRNRVTVAGMPLNA